MSSARATILERLGRARATARPPGPPAGPPLPYDGDETAPAVRFATELQAVGGEFVAASSDEEARRLVVELVLATGQGPVLAWRDEDLPLPGVGEALAAAGIAREWPYMPADVAARRAATQTLDGPAVGITGALAGLADTGSLVLLSGAGRPAVASLMPPLHIALLPRRAIVPDLRAFLAAHDPRDLTAWRNLVIITGPSRTADIEMILTRGVHGPKRVVVVAL